MPPRVSVVVPTYNAPALLSETLGGVFAQTFGDFELIVVNDGSTDETADVLAAIGDTRLRVITQPNAGIGAARNRGIDAARGEFVALLDHDDLWMPAKLAEQVRFMDEHPDCVGCSVPWSRSTTPGRPVYVPDAENENGIVRRPLRQLAEGKVFLITSAIMARRAVLDGLRYFTRPRCIEDTPLQVRLLCRGPFGIAGGAVLMAYRVHAENYSSDADFFLNGIRLLRELDADGYFAECAGQRADLDAFLAHLARTALARQLQAGRRGAAWRLYRYEFGRQWAGGAYRSLAVVPLALATPRFLWPAGLRRS